MHKKYTIFVLLALFWFCHRSLAYGASGSFVPTFAKSSAILIGEYEYSSDKHEQSSDAAASSQAKDVLVHHTQELKLSSYGYVYHPDLLLFSLAGGGYMIRDSSNANVYESSGDNVVEINSGSFAVKGELLQRKPYHSEFSYKKSGPSSSAGSDSMVENTTAEVIQYYEVYRFRNKLRYNYRGAETLSGLKGDSSERSSDDAHILYASSFFKRDDLTLSLSGSHGIETTESDLTQVLSTEEVSDRLDFDNHWKFKTFDFGTKASWDRQRSSEGGAARDKLDKSNFSEDIEVELPWNFEVDSRLAHARSSAIDLVEDEMTLLVTDDLDLVLSQQLFNSLHSDVSFKYGGSRSLDGSSETRRYGAKTNYVKTLRGGSATAGLRTEVLQTDRSGRFSPGPVIFEGKSVVVGNNIIELGSSGVDSGTIVVEVVVYEELSAPEIAAGVTPQIEYVDLTRDTHWSVESTGYPLQIKIDDLTGVSAITVGEDGTLAAKDPALDSYSFRVTYSTLDMDYVLQVNTNSFNAGIVLFDSLLSCDYDHLFTTQEIIEGDAGTVGLSPSVTDDYFVVKIDRSPFAIKADYQRISSDYRQETWSFNGSFAKNVSLFDLISSVLTLSYDRQEAQFQSGGSPKERESEYTLNGGLYSAMTIPRTSVKLTHFYLYEKNKGEIPSYQKDSLGVYRLASSATDDDGDSYETEIAANYTAVVPWLRLPLTFVASYNLEEDQDGKKEIEEDYGVHTSYRWYFVSSVFSVRGGYSVEGIEIENVGGGVSRSTDTVFEIYTKLTRKLF